MSYEIETIKLRKVVPIKNVDSIKEHQRRYKVISKCPNCSFDNEFLVLKGHVRAGNKVACSYCEVPYETV
jgi:hypothetical protein